MATYYNKELIDGISELPRMTKAEFDELSLDEKPINWICRNYTGTQRGIKSSDVEHGTGTVADKLNGVVYTGDLNDLKTTGFYGHTTTSNSNAPSDIPTGSLCTLTVNASGSLITQTLYYSSIAVYVRRFYNNSWNAWVKYYPDITSVDSLLVQSNPSTTETDYNCNWQNYNFLSIQVGSWDNIENQLIVPYSFFSTTYNGMRVIIYLARLNVFYEVWQNGSGKVIIKASASSSGITIKILGMIKK